MMRDSRRGSAFPEGGEKSQFPRRTRARIDARHIAHHRPCTDLLCAQARSDAAQRGPFALTAENGQPVLITAASHLDLLVQLDCMGHDADDAAGLDPGYPVSPVTADEIRCGQPITAPPLRLKDLRRE